MKKGKTLVSAFLILLLAFPCGTAAAEKKTDEGFDRYIALSGDGTVSVLQPEEVETYQPEELQKEEQKAVQYRVTVDKIEGRTYETAADAMTAVQAQGTICSPKLAAERSQISQLSPTYETEAGVVVFKNDVSTVEFNNKNTGASTYIAPVYAPDALYLGTEGESVVFLQAGCTGTVPKSSVYVISYDDYVNAGYITSLYKVSNGKIYHHITTNLTSYSSYYTVGYIQPYMTDGAEYFSFDGHYFYTSYPQMAKDYRTGTRQNAINPQDPYYNYYQYLSHRTTTSYTAAQINEYISARTADSSKLQGLGSAFIENQNLYGANAMLMFGLAVNESGWGMSQISQNKNNLFGHGAVDSNPYYGANGYASPADSVRYHAQFFVSRGYLDPTDWRYFGPHLGDKNSGMNVKYASDPYWGEKAASQSYLFADYFKNKTDVNHYTLIIGDGDQKIYTSPSTPRYFYSTGNGSLPYPTLDFPFTVLEQTTGETLNGSDTWYKIATDPDLKDDRSGFIIRPDGAYNPQNSYGYVHASQIHTVIPKSGQSAPPVHIWGGDINGDGEINSADAVLFNRYFAKWDVMIVEAQADLNQDGEISAADAALLQRYLAKWNYILNPIPAN